MSARSTLLEQLDQEWSALIGEEGFAGALSDAVGRHPVVEGFDPAARRDPDEADRLLHALLTAHADGNVAAGRAVLQCMLPAVRAIVRRSRRHYAELRELEAQAASAMWEAIATYDLAQITRVAMRLQGRTLTAVVGDRAPHARGRRVGRVAVATEVPMRAEVFESLVAESGERSETYFSLTSTSLGLVGEVLDLIAWGLDTGILDSSDAGLLTRLYAPDPALPEYAELMSHRGAYQRRIADELGLSHAAVRQRASRAVRRLVRAVEQQR